MRSVRYVGWREDLRGKTALARADAQPGRILIQCDDLHDADGAENPLAFGWHDFAADQWEDINLEGIA